MRILVVLALVTVAASQASGHYQEGSGGSDLNQGSSGRVEEGHNTHKLCAASSDMAYIYQDNQDFGYDQGANNMYGGRQYDIGGPMGMGI